ncbi:response regulator [Nostoc sp. CHAB 5715]|uniref:response regulator n=1 Tax=Nostoc sp. CHAB 5715 TaxID=2780400 RepID=UPI001E5E392C|nr:response regulator [Nostoc sp. CHAB 5715]MCC5622639.1 response regulator [Nostoc sp. CHAB 5715]
MKAAPVLAVDNEKSPNAGGTTVMAGDTVEDLHAPARPAAGSTPINILIVDDEPKNLAVLEAVLDNPEYRLVRAESAEQALLALLADDFALLILDIRMPGVTGFELAQLVKDRKKTALVPIIFLTAYYNEDQHVLEGYGNGAIDYLHKPVNAPVLRAKVAVFAELYRKQREADEANRALLAEVNSRRRAEDQLRELNNTLEQQVSSRTEHIRVLMNEVSHRSKNILSLVMVMAQQSAAARSDDFLSRFAKRIQALATNQDLLIQTQWQSVEMAELVQAQLALFEEIVGKRIGFSGPQLAVTAKASQSIGIALHELATNAAKYGALSTTDGRVDIAWSIEHQDSSKPRFCLSWSESEGPVVAAPDHRGFGTRVVKDMVEMALDGTVRLDYAPAGLSWRLECPALSILQDTPPP